MTTLDVRVPPKLRDMFTAARTDYRWRVLRGGRGSGKSFTVAKMAAIWGAIEPLRILCTREYQNSIKQSFHAELKSAIEAEPWLAAQYDVGIDYLRHKTNGTEFMFAGLRTNISSIKSMAQIDLCVVEEAETVPHASWRDLVPTIRAAGSGFIVIYNPRRRDSWVAQTFDTAKLPPRTCLVDINFNDNPWFPAPLDEQRLHDLEALDPALYAHIWEGAYYENSDAQVFAGKVAVQNFKPSPDWDGPYYGGDFGFSQDPTAAVEVWIGDGNLYIHREAVKIALELDDTASFVCENIPGFDSLTSRWDCARPESISHLKRHGMPKATAVTKWAGSVEDGIQYIRSFKQIIIHPQCANMQREARLYSYKIDRLSGDVTNVLVDAENHCWDAVRYALAPMIKQRGLGRPMPVTFAL